MSNTASSVVMSGLIIPLAEERRCRVALIADDVEYPILPRGAGIDLADMVSSQVEVKCTIEEEGERKRLVVRSYKVLDMDDNDDDSWYEDE